TKKAINQLQLFVNQYPYSSYTDSCYVLIGKLNYKLEQKAYAIAKQYFHMELYKSAIVAFDNFINDYPSSSLLEDAFFNLLKARYMLLVNSVDSKKSERASQLTETYVRFMDYFPDSRYLKEAEAIYEKALKEKEKIQGQKI
ncbi:MAG: outer membrane protein assembly factor BamD, partial [Bacteroidetes bacterium]